MSLGERGGSTATLTEAEELMEAHKALWSQTIRQAILESLDIEGQFHADDLLTLGIPPDCKNIVGAQVNALVRQRVMAETGERRSTSDPAGHGRRSAVYRITDLGIKKLRRVHQACRGEEVGGVDNPQESSALSTAESRGSSRGEGVVPQAEPNQRAAVTSGRETLPQGGGDVSSSSATTALPTLFELDASPQSHYEEEAA
jgi:hypothetical protein